MRTVPTGKGRFKHYRPVGEIDASGSVMGKQIEVVVEDAASDWPPLLRTR